jgi:uncharacterized protein YuzE
MKMKFDRKADAIYFRFNDEPVAYTKKLDDMRYIDIDANDEPIGIELLCVSDGVITDDLPHKAEVERALDDKGIKIYA